MKSSSIAFFLVLGWYASMAQCPSDSSMQSSDRLVARGLAYLSGTTLPYDPAKARPLLEQGAALGNGKAMNAMGNLYANGVSVPLDMAQALSWYEKAAGNGYTSAYFNLGMYYQKSGPDEQDFKKAVYYYRKGADAGNDNCKNKLAYLCYKGFGTDQDYITAFNLYKELAQKGDMNACYFLGLCYRNGYGTNADPALAKKWLTVAASSNDKQAIHELTAEPSPENTSLLTSALQRAVDDLKSHVEHFSTALNNDLSGNYTGYAFYYDFSHQYVHEVVPVILNIRKEGAKYVGSWLESDSLHASIKATYSGDSFVFDSNCRYVRRNYYSYGDDEPYRFEDAKVKITYNKDSLYLSGDLDFYSINRKEPGQPVSIFLSRKISTGELLQKDTFVTSVDLFPNPVNTSLHVNLINPSAGKVRLQIVSASGSIIQSSDVEMLPAGSFMYEFNTTGLASGTYILRMSAGNQVINKSFVKVQ